MLLGMELFLLVRHTHSALKMEMVDIYNTHLSTDTSTHYSYDESNSKCLGVTDELVMTACT